MFLSRHIYTTELFYFKAQNIICTHIYMYITFSKFASKRVNNKHTYTQLECKLDNVNVSHKRTCIS